MDATTGGIGDAERIVLVSDNGPCFKAGRFAAWIDAQPEFAHVRTRHGAPETNGVIERFFQSIKYEHLYRREIADGTELARSIEQAFVSTAAVSHTDATTSGDCRRLCTRIRGRLTVASSWHYPGCSCSSIGSAVRCGTCASP